MLGKRQLSFMRMRIAARRFLSSGYLSACKSMVFHFRVDAIGMNHPAERVAGARRERHDLFEEEFVGRDLKV